MYVDIAIYYRNGKKYVRKLLRESYRDPKTGKVKKRTVLNISHLSDENTAILKIILKNIKSLDKLINVNELEINQGARFALPFVILSLAKRTGLDKALGNSQQGKLALFQVFARLVEQGSRLSAVRLAQSHNVCDVFGLKGFNEDHLYANLAWLTDNQEVIEKRLFKSRCGDNPPTMYLYDVTSSYLEGTQNELASFGYNRDKKRGKMQIVIGLLTDSTGYPLAVRVFEGNTSDTKTVPEQIKTLAQNFGVKNITLVGDRGMLKGPQIELLHEDGFNYITAINKSSILKLAKSGVIQMELFEDNLVEVEDDGVRYILRRNPVRQAEIQENRKSKIKSIEQFIHNSNEYLAEHLRAKPETQLKNISARIDKLKLGSFLSVTVSYDNPREIRLKIDNDILEENSRLDGCYVIKTDLSKDVADTETVHARYKGLAEVEWAFRTMKQSHLAVRPIFVQTEKSTRGHVFVVMLAYVLELELRKFWSDLDVTVGEGLNILGSICGVEIMVQGKVFERLPKPQGMAKKLLAALKIELPESFPKSDQKTKPIVSTKTKLQKRRK